MRTWRPLADLERVLDALDAELLAATDEEVRQALRSRQQDPEEIRTVETPTVPLKRRVDHPRAVRFN